MFKDIIVGNLGGEPELKYSANGTPFLTFSVAANGRERTAEGEWVDRTHWVRVRVIGQRAESLSQYLHKGTRVYVDGRLDARPWLNQAQQPQAGIELVADEVQFMSPRDDQQQQAPQQRQQQAANPSPRQPVAAGRSDRRPTGPPQRLDDDLEDLPF